MNRKTAFLLCCLVAATCACSLWPRSARKPEQAPTLPVPSPTQTALPTPKPTPEPTPTAAPELFIESIGVFPDRALQALEWLDETTAWAIDLQGSIQRAAGQDKSWDTKFTPPTGLDSNRTSAHFFLDAEHAWVLYKDALGDPMQPYALYTTNDAGETWQRGGHFPNNYEPLSPVSMFFIDPLHGWFLGQIYPGMHQVYAMLYATEDGGASWELINDGTPLSENIDASLPGSYSRPLGTRPFTFLDAQTGFAGIYELYRTHDGGQTWQPQELPLPENNPALDNPYTYIAPPHLNGQSGVLQMLTFEYNDVYCPPCDISPVPPAATHLYITRDGGESWQPVDAPALMGTVGLASPDADAVWFLGRQQPDQTTTTLYWSLDGGESWEVRSEDTPLPLGARLHFIGPQYAYADLPDAGSGYPVQDLPNTADHELFFYRSDDGGVTWEGIE